MERTRRQTLWTLPKAPDEYYLFEETDGQIKYLGRGKKPEGAIIKEVTTVTDFFTIGKETSNS